MKNLVLALFFVFALALVMNAGSGRLPEVEKICSENKKYCLEIEPQKVENKEPESEDETDESEGDVEEEPAAKNYCKATFFAGNREIWSIRLESEDSPSNALISNDGSYVVTFEYWGDRDHALVIYSGASGRIIKKFGLSNFLTESDIDNLRSYSINWQQKAPVIDYDRSELVLSVANPPRGSEEFFKVRIDLTDGAVLDEVVDRIPTTKFIFITKEIEETIPPYPVTGRKNDCYAEEEEIFQFSAFDFSQKILQKELPEYPPAARAVRATGEAVFEAVISEEGEAACVSPVSGHPLLRLALINAIKKWKFEKRETKYKGNIIIEGKAVLMLNGEIVG